ncbi:ABC transporter permease, partial [Phenylobacterium sp.]|uniref:ABC transporter permease n=1 Tax=Phenylobacterium sp. TaxID=1871053 RepID=UPI0035B09E1C
LWRDPAAIILIVFAFTFALYSVSKDIKTEVNNAPIGVVDNDHSPLSRRLTDALQPPLFRKPVALTAETADAALETGEVIFVLEIPPDFEADLLRGRKPGLMLLIDATAMTQAGLGASYIGQIVSNEAAQALGSPAAEASLPVRVVPRTAFNPNHQAVWFVSVMQIVLDLTILSILLVGAAFMRERERGTIERLLVMPVTPIEVALSKIIANGVVVAGAAFFSLELIVRAGLGVPVNGSTALFMACVAPYLFSTAAIGILLATSAGSMPQFALMSIPVFVILNLLSGAVTPMESMPAAMRAVMEASPTTQFVALSSAILFRGAGLAEIWRPLAAIIAIGAIALTAALLRFRAQMAKAG